MIICEICAATPTDAAHLIARAACATAPILRRLTVPLCRACHLTFDRAMGMQQGRVDLYRWARYRAAFLALRAERDALEGLMTT